MKYSGYYGQKNPKNAGKVVENEPNKLLNLAMISSVGTEPAHIVDFFEKMKINKPTLFILAAPAC